MASTYTPGSFPATTAMAALLPKRVVPPANIFQTMKKEVDQFRNVIGILNPEVVRRLLDTFNWDVNRLVSTYLDDPDKVFTDTKIPQLVVSSGIYRSLTKNEKSCEICVEVQQPTDLLAMVCGHEYCRECWGRYVRTEIKKPDVVEIKCPGYKCKILLDEVGVKKVVNHRGALNLYYKKMTWGFVTSSPACKNMSWCPKPRCSNALVLPARGRQDEIVIEVKCDCGYSKCSRCLEGTHAPATCSEVANWQKRLTAQATSQYWKPTETVECPYCGEETERDYGHLIKCQNQENGGWFCFLCKDALRSPRDLHRGCKEFRPRRGNPNYVNLMKLKHNCNLYLEHKACLEKELAFKATAEQLTSAYTNRSICSADESKNIPKTIEIHSGCRRAIMNGYIVLTCREGPPSKMIDFENQHQELVYYTEISSFVIQRSFYSDDLNRRAIDEICYATARAEKSRLELLALSKQMSVSSQNQD